MAEKAAEKLLILNNAGQGIIDRLSFVKKTLSSPTLRPAFIGDAQYSKILGTLLKKFPEFEPNVEKSPGFDLLSSKSKVFFEELEPLYFAFVDAFEFKEKAVSVLNETAAAVAHMQLDDNPLLTTAFLSLLVLYAQLHYLLNAIEDRKSVMAVYYKLYFFIKCSNEPNFARVANFVNACDTPARSMQEEIRTVGNSLGATLVGLMPFYAKVRTVSVLRKEGVLNLTLKPEDLARPVLDKFLWQLVLDPQVSQWIAFGFLLCPEALSVSGAWDLLKLVLSETLVLPIARGVVLPIHAEYESTFGAWKSKTFNLTKHKKLPKEWMEEVVKKGVAKRREKRIYLRQEVNALYSICSDKPALLGPKFPIVLGAVALAREEVLWLYRHTKTQWPKSVKKAEDVLKDRRLAELVDGIVKLSTLLRDNRSIVEQYYLQYLQGADARHVSDVLGSAFQGQVGGGVGQLAQRIVEQLRHVTRDSLPTLRLHWARAEVALALRNSSVPIVKVRDAADRMALVVHHSKIVDELEVMVNQHGSLRELYYYRETFTEHFSAALKEEPIHAMTFFKLLADFPSNVTSFNAGEREEVGTVVVERAGKMLDELALRIVTSAQEIGKQCVQWDYWLQDVHAAYPLLLRRKDFKPPKDSVAPPTPGLESGYRKRAQLDKLPLYERNLWLLCASIQQHDYSFPVFDHLFTPREYLRERLAENLKKYLRSSVMIESGDEKHPERILQRPSIIERQLGAYISSFKMIDSYVDLDISSIVREVLLSEVWIPALGKNNSADWINVDETEFKYEDKTIGLIVNWYGDFVAKRLSVPGIVYSPNRQGFVSKTGMPFRAELYADVVEMQALARLVGPYGIKLIDREILKFILNAVNSLKEYLSHNKNVLEELKHNFLQEGAATDLLRKLKDGEAFVSRAIQVGNALHFRQLLREGLFHSVSVHRPFIHAAVEASFSQYRRNTFMVPELLPMDMLAMDCGISVGTADQTLKKFLSKSIGSADAALFDLLPYMFAASFSTLVWKDAVYRPVVEAHMNNAHTLVKTINDLVIAFKAITNSSGNEKEIIQQLEAFVEVSSVILLRMIKGGRDKHGPTDLASMIIFMDKFVQSSPLLTAELLERFLPYALLRNEWRSIYVAKIRGKRVEDPTDVY